MELNVQEFNFTHIDEIFKNATNSIADAEAFMSKAKPGIEKAKASKDGRKKVVAKASEIVNALLEPASKVADLLKFIGNFYPPCATAGTVLQGIVDVESGRRESDARIAVVYVSFATSLVQLGSLKPGFEHEHTLLAPLESLLSSMSSLMDEFGQFCEAFYAGNGLKNKFKHYINYKSYANQLDDYHKRLASFKNDLNLLLTHQAVLITSGNTKTLKDIEGKINQMCGYFAGLKDEPEAVAEDFIIHNGGEDVVLSNDALIKSLADKLGLELTSSILRAVKEGFEESFRQSYEPFQLKLQFAIESRIEVSTETIMRELQNGPYEHIIDPDMKAIWKEIGAKQSNLKRRQFIDAMVYYFRSQWKQFKINSKTDKADFWVSAIISKVHYQPAIGDAMDEDASGYLSVEEVNEFMQRKPPSWSAPQYVAYWAYGWDADNLYYKQLINKAYKQLESLRDKAGPKNAKIKEYLTDTQTDIQLIVNSLFPLDDLDLAAETQMKKLQAEWRELSEKRMKEKLKTVNYKIEYDTVSAVCGSDRIESTLLPLVSILLSQHIYIMSRADTKDEDIELAKNTMTNILYVVYDRIEELQHIWRRQRQDIDVQLRYYVNGLFKDYYAAHKKEFQADDGDELSEWDEDDEWVPDGGQAADKGQALAEHANSRPDAAPQARSVPQSQNYGSGSRGIDNSQMQRSQTNEAAYEPPSSDGYDRQAEQPESYGGGGDQQQEPEQGYSGENDQDYGRDVDQEPEQRYRNEYAQAGADGEYGERNGDDDENGGQGDWDRRGDNDNDEYNQPEPDDDNMNGDDDD